MSQNATNSTGPGVKVLHRKIVSFTFLLDIEKGPLIPLQNLVS